MQSQANRDGTRATSRWFAYGGLLLATVIGLPTGIGLLAGGVGLQSKSAFETGTVRRSDMQVTYSAAGHLVSTSSLDLKCEIAGGSTILWLVDEGIQVQTGDLLAELDSAQLTEQISLQRITTERAQADWVKAENGVQVAKTAVREYLEGTYIQQRDALVVQLTIAEENLRQAEDSLADVADMFRRGFVDLLKVDSQRFAAKRARLEVESARIALDVLDRFTKTKTLLELNSQAEIARANTIALGAAFKLETTLLASLESQLNKCRIYAPQGGTVIYANEYSKGPKRSTEQTAQIETGGVVREQQDVVRMPDLSHMETQVPVSAALAFRLQPGMPARIRVNKYEFTGIVSEVASQPRPPRPFTTTVEYEVLVTVQDDTSALKPRMTAEVEILLARRDNVTTVPVDAVVEQQSRFYCWVQESGRVERRALDLGLFDGERVEVLEGVVPGEEVVLDPRGKLAAAR